MVGVGGSSPLATTRFDEVGSMQSQLAVRLLPAVNCHLPTWILLPTADCGGCGGNPAPAHCGGRRDMHQAAPGMGRH